MSIIAAVSGGVDSVVLLDQLVARYGSKNVIVAHFDHGIRQESSSDARFVQTLAAQYGCDFALGKGSLGANASEAKAREARYKFLYKLADKYEASIATGHHLDDLVETVALNIKRGTGWRGLSPFGQDLLRPLLRISRDEVVKYAKLKKLTWVEDKTNQSDLYARNRVRPLVYAMTMDEKLQILALFESQWEIRYEVERLASDIGAGPYSRYQIIMSPQDVRREYLRYITRALLTRPQLDRMAHEICVAGHGKSFDAGSGVKVHFTTRTFTVELIKLE